MDYLWRHPMELKDSRLDALLGRDFGTPFEDAIRATITPFFAPSDRGAAVTELTAAAAFRGVVPSLAECHDLLGRFG